MNHFVGFCESYKQITDYYLIAHYDSDIPHIHFLFYSKQHVQLMTYYNKLRKHFVPNWTRDEYGITISNCESINAYLKYCLHQDKKSKEEGKQEYSLDDFVSSVDSNVIEGYIRSKKGTIDEYMLRDAVLDNMYDWDIIRAIGLANYHRYWREIEMMKQERAYLRQEREKERENRQNEINENIQQEFLDSID